MTNEDLDAVQTQTLWMENYCREHFFETVKGLYDPQTLEALIESRNVIFTASREGEKCHALNCGNQTKFCVVKVLRGEPGQ